MNMTFFPASQSKDCPAVVAPHVFSELGTIDADAGDVPVTAVDLVAGDPANYGGLISNDGCDLLKVEVTYLDGGDCSSCSDNSAVILGEPKSFYVLPGSVASIPDGFWQDLSLVVVDAADAPKPATQAINYFIRSDQVSPCPDCLVLAI